MAYCDCYVVCEVVNLQKVIHFNKSINSYTEKVIFASFFVDLVVKSGNDILPSGIPYLYLRLKYLLKRFCLPYLQIHRDILYFFAFVFRFRLWK